MDNPKILESKAAIAIQENRAVPNVFKGLRAFRRAFTVLCPSSSGWAYTSCPEYHCLNSALFSLRFLRVFPSNIVNSSPRTFSKMARSPSLPSKSEGHNPAEISETFALPELQMNPKPLIASLAHSIVASRGLDETASFTSL